MIIILEFLIKFISALIMLIVLFLLSIISTLVWDDAYLSVGGKLLDKIWGDE